MQNPLQQMVAKRRLGIHCGIPSFCCANKLVLEAILEQAHRFSDSILIEATSNQVNQFSGYTNMKPLEFKDFVYGIANDIGFNSDRIILGGDHLGPLPWANLPASEAMSNAIELVQQCILAGYKKIHFDTSMILGDDDPELFCNDTIAERSVILHETCEQAYQKLLKQNQDEMRPVYVIGSEVPVAGGEQREDCCVKITTPEDFENTLLSYLKKYNEKGMAESWEDVVAVVIQPGVDFSNYGVHLYNHHEARELCQCLKQYQDIVFEGHSTDYQPSHLLHQMVEDGIAIIKVGPAVTHAAREALFALSMMEKELVDEGYRADFIELLDKKMLENPVYWEKYYTGTDLQIALARKYSFSDRSRYYLADSEVEATVEKLFANLDKIGIPLEMLHQYMPDQYTRVRDGYLPLKAKDLVKSAVVMLVENYNYATKLNYIRPAR